MDSNAHFIGRLCDQHSNTANLTKNGHEAIELRTSHSITFANFTAATHNLMRLKHHGASITLQTAVMHYHYSWASPQISNPRSTHLFTAH
jgi:hypothetical protein